MNFWYLAATVLTIVTIGAHVIGGGPEIHKPVLESELAKDVKAVVSVIWHAITAILVLSAIWMGLAAMGRGSGAVPYIAAQFFAFSGLFMLYGALRLGSPFIFPQVYIFLILGLLAGVGYWRGLQV
ncbi:MAG: hypothetical protein L3J37_11060 [Rhodobacteraceae bacterium]|nr:hypothetical protein [Paracoccaceae bacterium]